MVTALHEAAHACVAVEVQRKFRLVDIGGDQASHGQIDTVDLCRHARRERVEADIVVLLAGFCAEQRATGQRYPVGAGDDITEAVELADRYDGTDLNALSLQAGSMVNDLWPQILNVAAVLLDERVLTDDEVRTILEAA